MKTKTKLSTMRVIWAVDAFEGQRAIVQGAAAHLAKTFASMGITVTPVFVLSEAQINLWSEMATPDLGIYKRMARDHMVKALSQIKINGKQVRFAPPQVLTVDISSKRSGAEALSAFAAKNRADLILVQTHGRRGVFRALIGSFTESLILVAKTPVLAVNPKVIRPQIPEHIVFFTDFSRGSRKALNWISRLAAHLGAKVTVAHAVPIPTQPVVQSGVALLGAGWVPVGAYLNTEISAQKKRVELVASELRRKGLQAEGVIVSDVPSVTYGALAFVKKRKPHWVSCAALSSQLRIALLGSLSRNLLREMKVPVLVIREQ